MPATGASGQPRQCEVEFDRGLKRDVTKIGLLFTGVGSIIGSGWLFGALNAAILVGPASVLSWLLGAIMIILVGLSYAELGVMFPVAGGVIRFPHYGFGSFSSYTVGWITWISAAATAPIEVLAAVQYGEPHLDWLMHEVEGQLVLTPAGIGVSVAAMFVFSLINILGVKAFARFNNLLVWWKLFILVLVILVFIFTVFHADHFFGSDTGGFLPNGADKIFAALPAAGIVFSYLGFRQGIEFAGETNDPQRNVPFAVIGSIVITCILYVGLQVAFIGALPDKTLAEGWSELTFANVAGPLAGLALLLSLGWLAVLLYVDAVVSPADTGLIFAAVTTRLSYSQARTGNVPSALARLNGRGVPWVSVILMFVFGCIFFLPFPSWSSLVGFITSGTVLSFGAGPVVVAAMRRQLPDQERPFRLPGGDVLPFLGFMCANLIVYWTGWNKNWKLFLAVLLGYALLGLFYLFARNDRSKIPPLQFGSGWWMLLWLGGLALISFLGHYSGGLDVLGLGVGEAVVIAFSLVIFSLAMNRRLQSIDVVQNVKRTHVEKEPELPA